MKPNKHKKIKTKRFILKRYLLHASIGGYIAGTVITLKCHKKEGTPIKAYWRKRLIESAIDGCMEEVVEPKPVKDKKVKNDTPAPSDPVEKVENREDTLIRE